MQTFLFRIFVAALLFGSGIFIPSTHADIIVAIENVTTSVSNPAGTAITADVSVSWDDTVHPGVDVDFGSLEFLIRAPFGATSSLAFLDPQHDSQLVNSAYLFHGNSFKFAHGIPPGTVSSTISLNDSYTAFDTRDDKFSDVRLGTLPRLMFQLDLVATGMPTGNENFLVELLKAGSSFTDNNGDPILFALKSGTQGVITLSGGAAAVPEPATSLIFLPGTGIAIWHCRRRRKNHLSLRC